VTHVLKTWPRYLDAIGRGVKTFEVRRDDRCFRPFDELLLREWDPDRKDWGKRWIHCDVTYVLHGGQFGIEPGYVVMGIRLPGNHEWPPEDNDTISRPRSNGGQATE